MPRKTTSKTASDAVIDRLEFSMAIPSTAEEPRPGAAVSLEMVNVFGEPVAEGAATAKGGPRSARLRLTAWVNNVSYVKDVWVDAYLTGRGGELVTAETLVLDYYDGAGGGGDFFILDAPVPSKGPAKGAIAGLRYRLYYQIGDSVYTDGILHEHTVAAVPKEMARPAAKPAAEPAPKVAAAGTPALGAPAGRTARRRPSA
jgi:hypothetical protein